MKSSFSFFFLAVLAFTPLANAGVYGQRNVTAQSFSSANGTVKTQDDDRSVILIASGATVATIMGVSVTMIAGEVIPIQAQSQDTLRSFSILVASGALVVLEQK